MNIFLSWSGERSKAVAEALRDWLPTVIQSLQPWMSKEDISKGARWSDEIAKSLKTCSIGIVCLTPENLNAPWLLFETGAISNNAETRTIDNKLVVTGNTKVCTYLYGLTPTDVKQPLAQFQATVANKDETHRLLKDIYQHLGEPRLSETQVNRVFEKWWPDLEKTLKEIPEPKIKTKTERTPEDMLSEILTLVRSIAQHQLTSGFKGMRKAFSLSEIYEPILRNLAVHKDSQLSANQRLLVDIARMIKQQEDEKSFLAAQPPEEQQEPPLSDTPLAS